MKKMFVMLFMLMVGFVCVNAQTIVERRADGVMKIDTNGDGKWDCMVDASRVPNWGQMRYGGELNNELGRAYVINQWRMYERMGENPENYLPNPYGNGNFTQYAGAYQHLLTMGGGYYGGYGVPGNVSVSVGGKNFGFGISVPVRGRNSGYGYTPNASVGVRVNGNHFGVSVPVSIVKKNKKQSTRTIAPQTRTRTQMSNDEIQQMMNNDYM